MDIETANTDEDRVAVRNFLARYIGDIAPDAVPALRNDEIYRPLVPWIREASGDVVAAALTCRSHYAAGAAEIARIGGPMPPQAKEFLPVLDRHSELDLLAVRPDFRGRGLGTKMLEWMETHLRTLGVRVWFGNVTTSLAVDDLRRFYERHGFTTTGPGEGLPPLLGRAWIPSYSEHPAFFFYKPLAGASPQASPDAS